MGLFGSKRESAAKDRIVAYKRVFGSPEGKEVLYDLMNSYHLLNTHHADPYLEGQRSVVLGILHYLHINANQFDQMMTNQGEES